MPSEYAADIAVKVKLDKQDIADQLAKQLKQSQKEMDGEYVTVKVRGDLSSLKESLVELSKENIKIGTDIRIETDQRELKQQLQHTKSYLAKQAGMITKSLSSEIEKNLPDNLTTSTLTKMITGNNRASNKQLESAVKKVMSEMDAIVNQGDFGGKDVAGVERALTQYQGVARLLGDINDILDETGSSIKIDPKKYSENLKKVYTAAGKYLKANNSEVITSSIQSIELEMQKAADNLQPFISDLISAISGESGKQIQDNQISREIQSVTKELDVATRELEEFKKSASGALDVSAYKDLGKGQLETQIRQLATSITGGSASTDDLMKLKALTQVYNEKGFKASRPYNTVIDVNKILEENNLLSDGTEELKKREAVVDELTGKLNGLLEKQNQITSTSANGISNTSLNVKDSAEYKQLAEDLQKANDQYDELLVKVSELRTANSNFESENEALLQQKLSVENELARVQAELFESKQVAQTRLEALNSINDSDISSDQYAAMVQQINLVQASLSSANEELEKNKSAISEYEKTISELSSKENEFRNALANNENEINSLKNTNQKLREEIDSLRAAVEASAKNALSEAASIYGQFPDINLFEQATDHLQRSLEAVDSEEQARLWDKAAAYYGIYVNEVKHGGGEVQRILIDSKDYSNELVESFNKLSSSMKEANEAQKILPAKSRELSNNQERLSALEKETKELNKQKQQQDAIVQSTKEEAAVQQKISKEKSAAVSKTKYKVTKPEETATTIESSSGKDTKEKLSSTVEVKPKVDVRVWKETIQKKVDDISVQVKVKPAIGQDTTSNTSQQNLNDSISDAVSNNQGKSDALAEIPVLPKIDIALWKKVLKDAVKKLKLDIDVNLGANSVSDIPSLDTAATRLVAYNRTLFSSFPENIINPSDIEKAQKERDALLSLYPILDQFRNRTNDISKDELIDSTEIQSAKELQTFLESSLIPAIEAKTNKFKEERKAVNDVVNAEVKKLDQLAGKLKEVTNLIDEKTNAFTNEKIAVETAVQFEKNKLSELATMLSNMRKDVATISKTEIKVKQVAENEETSSKSSKKKKKKNDRTQIDAALRETEIRNRKREDDAMLAQAKAINKNLENEYKERLKIQEQMDNALQKTEENRKKREDADTKSQAKAINKNLENEYKERLKVIEKYNNKRSSIENYINKRSTYKHGGELSQEYVLELNKLRELYSELDELKLGDNYSPEKVKEFLSILSQIEKKQSEINLKYGSDDFVLADREKLAKSTSDLEKFILKNSAMSSDLREQYQQLATAMRAALNADEFTLTEAEAKKFREEIRKLDVEFYNAGKTGRSMFDRIKGAIKSQTSQLIASYISLQDLIRYLRTAFNYVLQIDTALTELRKVSNASTSRLSQSFETSAKSAQDLGSSITDVINITADWSRLNKLGLFA